MKIKKTSAVRTKMFPDRLGWDEAVALWKKDNGNGRIVRVKWHKEGWKWQTEVTGVPHE